MIGIADSIDGAAAPRLAPRTVRPQPDNNARLHHLVTQRSFGESLRSCGTRTQLDIFSFARPRRLSRAAGIRKGIDISIAFRTDLIGARLSPALA